MSITPFLVLDYYMVSELCEGGDLRSLLYSVDERGNMHESLDRLVSCS